jgi:hypothetical protein
MRNEHIATNTLSQGMRRIMTLYRLVTIATERLFPARGD